MGNRAPPPPARRKLRSKGFSLLGRANSLIATISSLFRCVNSLLGDLGNWLSRPAESLAFLGARIERYGHKIAKFPVNFPVSREFGTRDGFARRSSPRHLKALILHGY